MIVNTSHSLPFNNYSTRDDANLSTTTDEPLPSTPEEWKISLYRSLVPVMLICCVISFCTNLSILIAVRWVRRSLSPTLCFSVSLAVSDAYASLVLGVGLLLNSLLPIGFNIHLGTYCTILVLEGFRLGGVIVSILHLLMLAVNHYLGIIRPLHYASTMTKRNALLSIFFMWILPLIFIFAYFASVPGEGFQSEGCNIMNFLFLKKFRLMIGSLIFAPLFLMLIMYVHMFIVVYQHNQALQQYQGSRNFRQNVKAAITTLVIIGTYTIGWMPAICFFIIVCNDCVVDLHEWRMRDEKAILVITIIINTLMIFKYMVNPIIYATRMRDIHMAFKRMIASCWPRYCSVTGIGINDESTSSSFVRSRNDTMQTTIRLQSVYGRNRGGGVSPILMYQKCNAANCKNGNSANRPNGGRSGGQ